MCNKTANTIYGLPKGTELLKQFALYYPLIKLDLSDSMIESKVCDLLWNFMTYYQSLRHNTNLYDIQPNSMKFYKAIITLLGEKLGKVTKIFKKWRKSEICAAAAGGGSGLSNERTNLTTFFGNATLKKLTKVKEYKKHLKQKISPLPSVKDTYFLQRWNRI